VSGGVVVYTLVGLLTDKTKKMREIWEREMTGMKGRLWVRRRKDKELRTQPNVINNHTCEHHTHFTQQSYTCSYVVSHVNLAEVLQLSVNQHGHIIEVWAVEFLFLCFTLRVAGYFNSGQPLPGRFVTQPDFL